MSQYEICKCCGKPKRPKQNNQRFPANLLLSHSVWCVPNGVKKVKTENGGKVLHTKNASMRDRGWGYGEAVRETYSDSEGMEQVEDWLCDESCPVRLLDEQSGMRKSNARPNSYGKDYPSKDKLFSSLNSPCNANNSHDDQGGASRYFQRFSPFIYQAKASRSERNSGCEGLPEVERSNGNKWTDQDYRVARGERSLGRESGPRQNTHPTVKPLALCRYLVRMITPPGGIVLDCFAGSGSTLVAAIHEGMHFIGVEQLDTPEEPYISIARARIEQAFREVQS